MDTLNKISELLKERKISQSELCSFLGIKKNAYTNWKSGHTSSYKKYLPQIADYLNCSVDYLLGREESSNDSSTPDPYDLFGQVMPGKARMIPVFETVSAGFGRQANDVAVSYTHLAALLSSRAIAGWARFAALANSLCVSPLAFLSSISSSIIAMHLSGNRSTSRRFSLFV